MPKQLLALLGKGSFLQQAVNRVLPLVPAKNIFVITNEVQLPEVRKQLPKIPKANLIAEPIGRDTCAAVTLGAALVGARSTTGVMAVLPADHVIPDEKKFQQVLSDAFDFGFAWPGHHHHRHQAGRAGHRLRLHSHRPGIAAGAGREKDQNHFLPGGTVRRETAFLIRRSNTSTAASIAGTPACSSGRS